uniref:DNA 3'-5' helicase n=1 Tax=Saccoglossus kowalevskii TaxID=10224 RepID=A0ABM0MGI7_SACKO|nr:PREDICTED: Bloom syndrome protein homolog [Saccoglossus kowalevskii]
MKHDNVSVMFKWLLLDLGEHGRECNRMIIFCRKRRHCSDLYEMFKNYLGDKAYDKSVSHFNRLFGMFHSKTNESVKQHIISSFQNPNGVVRVLFTTIAFGMGMDVKGVHQIIHLGPSNDIDEYMQETGRAGRDASVMASVVLVKYPGSLRSSRISKLMKGYCRNVSSCRRKFILAEFQDNPKSSAILHTCCDICSLKCRCLCACDDEECFCEFACLSPDEYLSKAETNLQKVVVDEKSACSGKFIDSAPVHLVTNIQRKALETYLFEYRSTLLKCRNENEIFVGADIVTGFSRALISQVVKYVQFIENKNVLQSNFCFFSPVHVNRVWDIVLEVLEASDSDLQSDVSEFERIR